MVLLLFTDTNGKLLPRLEGKTLLLVDLGCPLPTLVPGLAFLGLDNSVRPPSTLFATSG